MLMQVNTTRSREELEIGEVFRLWLNQLLVVSEGEVKERRSSSRPVSPPVEGNQMDRGSVNKGGSGAGEETGCKGS